MRGLKVGREAAGAAGRQAGSLGRSLQELGGTLRKFTGDERGFVNTDLLTGGFLKSQGGKANNLFRRISSRGLEVFDGGLDNRRNFETLRGANLDPPNNFPGIDRINRSRGLGTSMKTIDLRSKSAVNLRTFRTTVRGHIESLRKFKGNVQRFSSQLQAFVRVPSLRARRLELGVQADRLSAAQRRILSQEARRARNLRKDPVDLAVFEIKGN